MFELRPREGAEEGSRAASEQGLGDHRTMCSLWSERPAQSECRGGGRAQRLRSPGTKLAPPQQEDLQLNLTTSHDQNSPSPKT